ncbi:MAG: UvrD-helicase domain-containing protein [Bacteroidales bacterium]|nr:UvrD-helicase domain-containing protein [Bacteroidales bacterium]
MENNVRAILDSLNDEQGKAVQCTEGPVLIVAGAGSGKTRVLTSRVAYLLAGGADPARILALTFTKKAAGEMKERIALLVGAYKARRVVMGTFHSVFVRFLREWADSLGYPQQFTIYDQSDSTAAVKAAIKELGLDDTVYKPRDVLSRISSAKNNLITVSAYRSDRGAIQADTYSKKPRIVDVYERYQQNLRKSGVMDFDDILVNMNILLRDNPQALQSIASRFSYIMVDEYQDTNYAQYLIIKKLAQGHRNICVVGDDSQSIYAFRGAQIQNILNFKKDYPECRLFRLERNYRSTPNIVEAANSVIEHNAGRIPKKCYAQGDPGEKLKLIQAYTEQDEAVEIVSAIQKRMRTDGAAYQDFAILYRTNAQSRALEEQLRRRNIPYIVYSGNSFFERAEVKDMLSYFKLVVNPLDEESFKRVVNKPARAIGDTSVKALIAAALAHGTSLFRAAFLDDLEQFGLRSAAVLKIRAFCAMIDALHQKIKTTGAFDLAREIADKSGLYAFYKDDTSIEGQARFANVEELVNSVAAFEEERRDEAEGAEDIFTLDDYLENVSLLSNVDLVDEDDTNNKVALMTVHSAKGLEFPYVFVAGMEENLFPSQSMLLSQKDIEEERRLFYVAITRAGKAVSLSYAGTRMRNGRHESNSPSRFLREIDSQYLDRPLEDDSFGVSGAFGSGGGFGRSGFAQSYARPPKPSSESRRPEPARSPISPVPAQSKPAYTPDPDFVPLPMTEFRVGQRIEHNRFGPGEILDITGTVPELKARVRFDTLGEKLLLLKYAKMRLEKK